MNNIRKAAMHFNGIWPDEATALERSLSPDWFDVFKGDINDPKNKSRLSEMVCDKDQFLAEVDRWKEETESLSLFHGSFGQLCELYVSGSKFYYIDNGLSYPVEYQEEELNIYDLFDIFDNGGIYWSGEDD